MTKLSQSQLTKECFDIVLENDEVTTRDFVVFAVEHIFDKSNEEAQEIISGVHKTGSAVLGSYTYETALVKRSALMVLADAGGFPLQCTVKDRSGGNKPTEGLPDHGFMKGQWEHNTQREASYALSRERFTTALQLSLEWVGRCPDEKNAHLTAAASCQKLKQYHLAIGFFNRALEIDPKVRSGLVNRAECYLESQKAEEALQDATMAIELYPGDLDARRIKRSADWMIYESWVKKYTESEALNSAPSCAAAYVWRAWAKCIRYQYADAIKDCEEAISSNSCVSAARLCRAWAYLGMNNIAAADQDYRALSSEFTELRRDAVKADVLLLKAYLLMTNLLFDDALAACNRALKLWPSRTNAQLTRAHILCCLNRLDEAVSALEPQSGQEISPKERAYILSNMARVHLRRGTVTEALETINAAIALEPEIPAALATKGLIAMKAEMLEEAEKALTEAISIDPYYAEAYWFRHQLYEKLGRREESWRDQRTCQKYDYKPCM
jgi:ATP-dependent Clp protease adaptor protein ClpS